MRASIAKALLLGGVLLASAAMAEPDEFGLGDGGAPDGGTTLTAQTANQVVNKYAQLVSMPVSDAGMSVLAVNTVQTGSGNKPSDRFPQGSLVMVIQMGAETPADGLTSAVNLEAGGIGRWELARVTQVRDAPHNDLTLDRRLVNTYPPVWTQVVHVPEYTTVSIPNGTSLSADPWSPVNRMGGVLAFLAQGAINLNMSGALHVDGKGFRGAPGEAGSGTSTDCTTGATGPDAARRGEGVYTDDFGGATPGDGMENRANAGGGGVCVQAGGGGGANGGAGGRGGNSQANNVRGGNGGAPLLAGLLSDRLTLGGGGGSGHGSNANGGAGAPGGGIMFIRAAGLQGQGEISASGESAAASAQGAGGGGGGGTIHIRLGGYATCSRLEALGGTGGNNTNAALAPGGGGGGGRVFFQAQSSSCAPSSAAGLAGTTSSGGHRGAEPDAASVGSRSGQALFLPQKYEVPPAPTVTKPAHNGSTQSDRPLIEGTTVSFAEVRIFVNGTLAGTTFANNVGFFSFTYSGSPLGTVGTHTVSAEVIYLGAKSARSSVNTFTVDTSAPQIRITGAPTNPSRSTTAIFTFDVNPAESGVRFECQFDGASAEFKPCESPWVFTTADRALPLYVATIRALDKANNSTALSHSWAVDSTPPTRPVIDVPVQNGTVGSARPTFSGTAQNAAGLTVSLRLDNSTTIATNVPVTGGDWTWPWPASPAAILPDGPHVVVATVTDAAGNESPPSEVRAFVVDADAPDEPTILAPAGSFVKRRTFTVAGTAEAKGVVTVAASLFDGSLYQPVQSIDRTVDDTGAWSVDFDVSGSALATNGRSLRVTATVRDGAAPPNTSPVATRNFTLDLLGPTVDIASGPPQRTNARGVVFTFTASEQTSFFECQLDSGSFALCLSPHSVTVTTPGPHELCVQATDLAGNTTDSNDVACRSWTLDEAAPTHPVVTTPSETAAPMDESTPLFEGTAEPGSTIQLYLNGVPLGSDTTPNPVMTTAGGAWSARPATARPSGFYVLTATARDAAGNVSSFSAGRAFTLDRDDPPSPVFTAPAEASHVRTARPKFTGTAEPNSTVILAADGPLALGQASANGNGVWTLDLANSGPNLPEGVRTVTAVARDAAQNTGVSATLTLTVDLTDPTAPVLTWPPAHTLPAPPPRTREAMPVIRGTAEPGAHIAVSIDGVEAGTATADASRNWTFTPLARLSDGAHTVTATARDASGRVGPVSASRAFTVDTTGPGKPVITLPAAHAYVNTLRPRFEGRAEPSSTVTVLVDSNTVPAVTVVAGTATADAQGQWGFQVPEASPLSEGLRSAEAYATDDLGNQGGNSEVTLSFTVDVTAPVAPLVESPADGAPVASTSPVISGRAESGSTVSVFLDGSSVAVGTTTAATTQDGLAGAWSFRVPGPLAQGGHTVRARATDRATNSHTENSISASQSFTVDTLAPNTKILSGPPLVSASTAAKFVVRALVQETTNVDGDVVAFEISRDGRGFIECVLGSSASDCTVQKNTDPLFPLDAYVITLTEPFEVRQDHRVLISARDPAGNRDPTPDAYAWRVVDGVLTIGIKFGPDPITSDNTSTFVFESQRPGAIFTGTMGITDGGTPESFRVVSGQDTITFPVTDGGVPDGGGPVLVDGDYELKVRAVNPDNASDQTGEGLYRWTIDTVRPSAPILNVDGQQDGGTVWVNTSTPTFRGTAEPRSTITILNNSRQVGEAITDDMGKWSLLLATGLTQGEYTTFSARATDRAGNTSGSVAGPEVIIDQTPPTVGVTSGPLSQTNLQIAPFTFSRSELVRSFQCSLDNAPFVVCGTNEDPGKTYNDANLLSEGPHNLALKATDLAGNETVRVVNYTWRVDLTPPIVTIATKPPEQSGSANSRFTFTANETPVTYRCSLDGSGFGECSQTYVPPPQDDGPHVLRVQAQDSAGNSMPAPVEYHWVVDTGAPAAPVLQDPAVGRPVGSTKPVFRGTSEPNSTVTVLVDGVAVATKQVIDGLGRWDVASDVDLTEEGHTVRLVAQDRAGNQSEPSDPVSFVVDVTGPNTVIQSGPESRIRSTSATFVFSSEEGATFECSLNRGAFEPCPADGVFSGLEEGGQSLEVRAMDAAGNPDKTPAVYSWRVYLGSDIRTRGGGLSCSSTQGGSGASLALLGLSGLVLLRARRRRR